MKRNINSVLLLISLHHQNLSEREASALFLYKFFERTPRVFAEFLLEGEKTLKYKDTQLETDATETDSTIEVGVTPRTTRRKTAN